MYCSKCGKEIRKENIFCTNCGKPTNENVQLSATTSQKDKTEKKVIKIKLCHVITLFVVCICISILTVLYINSDKQIKDTNNTSNQETNIPN